MPNTELMSSFLQETEEVIGALESGLDVLKAQAAQNTAGHAEAFARLSMLAHRMRGSAGLYGYPQLSTLAGLLERLYDSRPELSGALAGRFLALLGTVTATLRGGLDTLKGGGSDRDLGLTFTRVGGSQQLQELVQAVPEAFRMRESKHRPSAEEGQSHAANQPAHAAPEGLEGALRGFVLQNPDIWEYFAPEVQEHIANLRQQLAAPEAADPHSMFRSAHTIKGSAYMVGLEPLGDFAHSLEDLLGAVREDAVGLSGGVPHTLQSSLDLLDDLMAVAEGREVAVAERAAQLSAQLRTLAGGGSLATPQALNLSPAPATPDATPLNTTIRVPAQRLEGLMEQVSSLVSSRARMSRLLAQMDDLQSSMLSSQQRFQRTVRDFEERYLNPDMVRGQEEAAGKSGGMGGNFAEQFAELEFDTYDDLNILSRSITELSADFSEMRRRLSDNVAHLNEENETLGKLMRQLRLDLNQTSRVPFTQATARLRRWARDHEGQFDLTVSGEDVQLESTLLQGIVDPLLHLLTNAVHHGLADTSRRAAAGKPERGQVWVRATEQSNFIDITVADDGQGLNLARIKEKALEKGLRSAQELSEMRDSDAANLILLPGLSTEDSVGSRAGRGVGMDVVGTTVRQLGGELLIQTEAGVGTAFTLRLPTTQRIMDVLEVQLSAQQWAAFPVGAIRALRDLPEGEVMQTTAGPRLMFGGELLPIIDAREFWGGHHEDTGDLAHFALLTSITGLSAVRVMGFGRIEEVSVSPVGTLLGRLDYLAGLSTSSSGQVLPILEVSGLARLARRPEAWLGEREQQAVSAGQKLLLVDDSLSVRRLVSRMLERAGYAVHTANDGQEALDILQLDDSFQGVITDLEMPRMNGYELLSAIRSRPESQHLPVLIMTTRAGEKHQRVAFQLGANDYFTKPVNETLLLRRIASLMGTQARGQSLLT